MIYYFTGSVFVRELCSILQTYAHKKGLSDLMTLVNNRVSKSNIPGNRVQMPCNTSCLTRKNLSFTLQFSFDLIELL